MSPSIIGISRWGFRGWLSRLLVERCDITVAWTNQNRDSQPLNPHQNIPIIDGDTEGLNILRTISHVFSFSKCICKNNFAISLTNQSCNLKGRRIKFNPKIQKESLRQEFPIKNILYDKTIKSIENG